jgi:Transcription factor WhiB
MAELLFALMAEIECGECGQFFKNAAQYGHYIPQHTTPHGKPCAGSNKSLYARKKPARPVDVPRTWNWQDDANCLDTDPSIFDNPYHIENARQAVQICKECPVRDWCWQYAKDDPFYEGIEGGALWIDTKPDKDLSGRKAAETPYAFTPQAAYASAEQLTIFGRDETEDDGT